MVQGHAKWDLRFLDRAADIATWSKDPSSRIGAVIVRPDRTSASEGFNGFARGVSDDEALYANRDYKIATVLHAELNAILTARERLDGYTIYVSGLPPCAQCAAAIIQTGIRRVVCFDGVVPERWKQNMEWAAANLKEAGITVDFYDRETRTRVMKDVL